jgi:2-polyprenyl-3-methyl-5-hydroxy-6-metoxy-1,4-benzoquinol methylase
LEQNKRLTTKEYWTNQGPDYHFEKHKGHPIESLIKKYIPFNPQGSCIEIGSFPGPFLTVLGDLGYTLNGIDFNPMNEKELPRWLKAGGYKVDEFVTTDFFSFDTANRYDAVTSFGFIEHFDNYEEVIAKHAALVQDGGYLVITTPNFRGAVQQWLHRTFDRQNLRLHNTESMQPGKWRSQLEAAGFEVLFSGHFGGFEFWRSPDPLSRVKKKLLWLIWRMIPRLNRLLWFESASLSAHCGIVAKRKQHT